MGKKAKTGKARKDKFYHLAKETGYRARSAFKLIQLNRKFQFLQKSRVLVDLCAAPGGWLQVASKNMPVSSVIVGVDLVPIKPIPNVITFQGDITTQKCRQTLQRELKTWKADCVLHDGAPNVGKNWLHDAFSQAQLTLQAVKLASEFLMKGGWFVSKVFRSKDYQALVWVLRQLFHKVHTTKPQASRSQSAEIFVVCQGFLAPDKIDPKFFDPMSIFKEVSTEPSIQSVFTDMTKKPKAEGYPDNDHTLYHKKTVMELTNCQEPLEFLSTCNEITFDDERMENHKLTSEELKHCFKDIKVLGKKDIRLILAWRKKMIEFVKEGSSGNDGGDVSDEEKDGDDGEEEESDVDDIISKLKSEESKEAKQKKRKMLRARRRLRERMALKMDLPGDQLDFSHEKSLFGLKKLNNKKVSFAGPEKSDKKMEIPKAGPEKKDREIEIPKEEKSGKASEESAVDKRELDAEGLALGTLIATSKKKRREIIEHAYNRNTYGDQDNLPDWFAADEAKHYRKQTPVTKELVQEYRDRLKDINARPIKKVAEAKARKKKRSMKKMEKARKKAEAISDTVDMSDREKMSQIKSIYKKAGTSNKKVKTTYVVAKKSLAGKRAHRPAGVKGPFKMVDKRMKKEVRAKLRKEGKGKKKKRR